MMTCETPKPILFKFRPINDVCKAIDKANCIECLDKLNDEIKYNCEKYSLVQLEFILEHLEEKIKKVIKEIRK